MLFFEYNVFCAEEIEDHAERHRRNFCEIEPRVGTHAIERKNKGSNGIYNAGIHAEPYDIDQKKKSKFFCAHDFCVLECPVFVQKIAWGHRGAKWESVKNNDRGPGVAAR